MFLLILSALFKFDHFLQENLFFIDSSSNEH